MSESRAMAPSPRASGGDAPPLPRALPGHGCCYSAAFPVLRRLAIFEPCSVAVAIRVRRSSNSASSFPVPKSDVPAACPLRIASANTAPAASSFSRSVPSRVSRHWRKRSSIRPLGSSPSSSSVIARLSGFSDPVDELVDPYLATRRTRVPRGRRCGLPTLPSRAGCSRRASRERLAPRGPRPFPSSPRAAAPAGSRSRARRFSRLRCRRSPSSSAARPPGSSCAPAPGVARGLGAVDPVADRGCARTLRSPPRGYRPRRWRYSSLIVTRRSERPGLQPAT